MEVVIVVFAVIPIFWFIVQSILEYVKTNTATKYFQFGDSLKQTQFLSTLLASNSGLSGAIYLIAVYGWLTGALTGLWAIVFFGLTMVASQKVIKRIGERDEEFPNFLAERGTLHEFLGKSFQSRTVRIMAGTASLFAYIGLVACEIVLAQEIIEALLSVGGLPEAWATLARFVLTAMVIAYTFAAGFRAVIKTESVQIWLMIGMLLAGIAIIVATVQNHPGTWSQHSKVYGDSIWSLLVAPKTAASTFDHLFIFVFLNIVFWGAWWPVAMDQWHRTAATRSEEISTNKVAGTASILTFVYLAALCVVFAMLGSFANCVWQGDLTNPLKTIVVGYVTDSSTPTGSLPFTSAMIAGLFLAGLIAAIVSTMDTYLIVAAQSLVVDVISAKKYGSMHEISSEEAADIRVLPLARIGVLGVGITTVLVSLWFSNFYDVYEAIYASFALQFASLGPLLVGLYVANPAQRKNQAIFAIGVSLLASVVGMTFIILRIENAANSGIEPTAFYRWLYAWPEIVMLMSVVLTMRPVDLKHLARRRSA